jgi:hypothetical protein
VPALELRIPPLALVIATALLMWLGSAHMPGGNFEFPFHSIFAWVFSFWGLIICTLGVIEFKNAKTTVNPTKPQSSSPPVPDYELGSPTSMANKVANKSSETTALHGGTIFLNLSFNPS